MVGFVKLKCFVIWKRAQKSDGKHIAYKLALIFLSIHREITIFQFFCVCQRPSCFIVYLCNFHIHIKNFTLIKTETFNNVLKSMGMNRLFKSLSQQILAAFWIRNMTIHRGHNVVGHKRLTTGKKPRLRLTICLSSPLKVLMLRHVAISPYIGTSVGIQWLLHPARYFCNAHWYLMGTNWFTLAREHGLIRYFHS